MLRKFQAVELKQYYARVFYQSQSQDQAECGFWQCPHNIALIRQLEIFAALGQPLLVGLSRKSVLGQMTGNDVDARLYASIAASVIAAQKGAKILRVHDVKATVQALKVVAAIQI